MPSKKTSVKSVDTEQLLSTVPVTDSTNSVVEKKTRKSKTPKVDATATATVTASSTSSSSLVVDSTVPVNTVVESVDLETPLAEQSNDFLSKLQQICSAVATLKTEFRVLEKKWAREIKVAQKQSSKRKRKAGNRAPSGFVKPTKISDELASFLGKEKGSEMARTDVTREINTYIRAHDLQDKSNGRKIIPDTKLATLLKLKKTDELTYFNLQRYMSPHFAKAVKLDVVV
jgi:upstream activation factor subunit UAF30